LVDVEVKAKERIVKIELFYNGFLLDVQARNFGRTERYEYRFTPEQILAQNVIKVVATDEAGTPFAGEVIVSE
jgi:hypothetical protein